MLLCAGTWAAMGYKENCLNRSVAWAWSCGNAMPMMPWCHTSIIIPIYIYITRADRLSIIAATFLLRIVRGVGVSPPCESFMASLLKQKWSVAWASGQRLRREPLGDWNGSTWSASRPNEGAFGMGHGSNWTTSVPKPTLVRVGNSRQVTSTWVELHCVDTQHGACIWARPLNPKQESTIAIPNVFFIDQDTKNQNVVRHWENKATWNKHTNVKKANHVQKFFHFRSAVPQSPGDMLCFSSYRCVFWFLTPWLCSTSFCCPHFAMAFVSMFAFRCSSLVCNLFTTCSHTNIQSYPEAPPPYMCLPVSVKERLLLHESFLLHMVKMCFFSIQISSIHERYSPSKRSHLSQDHSLKKIPPLWRVPWTLCLN